MGTTEKPSIWHSFSSDHRKERKERKERRASSSTPRTTQSSSSHYPSWLRGRGNSSDISDKPPPYTETAIPAIQITSPEATETESDSQYSFLADFDTIFLVDDSSSMQGRRWKEAEAAIAAIAPICTKYDSDGIDIYFLNHRDYNDTAGGYHNITTASQVHSIFNRVHPRGPTRVGSRLFDILDPYMRRVEAMHAAKREHGNALHPALFVKPVNIITITDGEFTDDAEGIIVKTAKMLDGPSCDAIPWQVGIQFFQIGNDENVRRYLEDLDDHLGERCRDLHMRDIVDTVSWRNRDGDRLEGDGILKTVLGAVNKRLDRRTV
ncbi:uncharacterized protein N7515_007396 [Penicillium bovifimosum]|uniref:VWFA domain-containing protein n=1 Tax=Penicillium bovifimosum TaxID=126998 RepID=A0A9W9L259_9EURO|nr:uncharacterized protein N7515_007396 [Penicillium bovifimosum]KAJ5131357.1 hypothetical protein N7515_007396 [Penicillium bovifimosum]